MVEDSLPVPFFGMGFRVEVIECPAATGQAVLAPGGLVSL
jgi:hypothetical protein